MTSPLISLGSTKPSLLLPQGEIAFRINNLHEFADLPGIVKALEHHVQGPVTLELGVDGGSLLIAQAAALKLVENLIDFIVYFLKHGDGDMETLTDEGHIVHMFVADGTFDVDLASDRGRSIVSPILVPHPLHFQRVPNTERRTKPGLLRTYAPPASLLRFMRAMPERLHINLTPELRAMGVFPLHIGNVPHHKVEVRNSLIVTRALSRCIEAPVYFSPEHDAHQSEHVCYAVCWVPTWAAPATENVLWYLSLHEEFSHQFLATNEAVPHPAQIPVELFGLKISQVKDFKKAFKGAHLRCPHWKTHVASASPQQWADCTMFRCPTCNQGWIV